MIEGTVREDIGIGQVHDSVSPMRKQTVARPWDVGESGVIASGYEARTNWAGLLPVERTSMIASRNEGGLHLDLSIQSGPVREHL